MRRTLLCLAACLLLAGCVSTGDAEETPPRTWVLARIDEPVEVGDDGFPMHVRFVRTAGEAATWDLADGVPVGDEREGEPSAGQLLRYAPTHDLGRLQRAQDRAAVKGGEAKISQRVGQGLGLLPALWGQGKAFRLVPVDALDVGLAFAVSGKDKLHCLPPQGTHTCSRPCSTATARFLAYRRCSAATWSTYGRQRPRGW